jgi:hypothetical protein
MPGPYHQDNEEWVIGFIIMILVVMILIAVA